MKKVFYHVNTEICVNLKLITTRRGRMPLGRQLTGTLVHDDPEHFTFVEDGDPLLPGEPAPLLRPAIERNPIIYQGKYINVHRAKDGTLYPTFCRPLLTERFTFRDFCLQAADELRIVARCLEKVMPGMSLRA